MTKQMISRFCHVCMDGILNSANLDIHRIIVRNDLNSLRHCVEQINIQGAVQRNYTRRRLIRSRPNDRTMINAFVRCHAWNCGTTTQTSCSVRQQSGDTPTPHPRLGWYPVASRYRERRILIAEAARARNNSTWAGKIVRIGDLSPTT